VSAQQSATPETHQDDDPLSALRTRIADYGATGQSQLILGAKPLNEADAALAAVDWADTDAGADAASTAEVTAALLAIFHRQRAGLLDGADRIRELGMAAAPLIVARGAGADGVEQPSFPVKLSRAWHGVGMRLLGYAERTAEPDTAVKAVRALQNCVAQTGTHDLDRADYISNLGAAYSCYFEYTGDRIALTAAIGAYRRARALAAAGQENYPVYCSNLGAALMERFELSGYDADLDEAIDAQSTAVAATRTSPERAFYLSNLGASHTTRFERTGDAESLDLAIEALQRAVAESPADDPDLATREANLGRVRVRRYEQTADTDTLFAAIASLGAAAEATEPGDPDYPPRLSNLAGAFIYLFERTGDLDSLDMAIEALQEATSRPHRLRATHLTNLGTAHQRRFNKTRDPASADAAIATYAQALRGTPPGDPSRAGLLSNLGNARLRRGRPGDLEQAIAELDMSVRTAPADDPDRTMFLANRADALAARFERGGDTADLAAALRDYTDAADGPSPALNRARAALSRGRLAASVDPGRGDALDGFAQAIGLIDQVIWRGLSRLDGERLLREFAGAASDAAACAIAVGDVELAVELLEQGRGVLLGQALDTHASYDTLLKNHSVRAAELADRFVRLQHALERPELPRSLSEPRVNTAVLADGERFIALARERDEVLAAIRKLPGYADFPRARALDAAAVAAEGPVVAVNVSRYRCDALAITPTGVELIELPRLTADQTARVAKRFLRLVRRIRALPQLSPAEHRRTEGGLREILAWLWDTVAGPVLDQLGLERSEERWPRLWWCPTGALGLLPLHCAQRYDPTLLADDGVMDRVAASYTPTVRALLVGRARPAAGPETRGLLAVAMPRTPGKPLLRGTEAEIAAVGETLIPAETLLSDAATTPSVTAGLRDHRWLHYIGHSAQNLRDPGAAALFLHDRALTMREIAALHLEHAEFAYLSSCESTLGAIALPDEALHLAGALVMAGYRQVIATSWSIRDDAAVHIAGAVYRGLAPGGIFDPAGVGVVLHRTLREIRATQPLLVSAAYSHTGP
jgi:hypothetical protein